MEAAEALAHWGRVEPVHPAPDAGLINQTWLVGAPATAVLQWVNPIFKGSVHLDIEAITARLEARGLLTPRLIPTSAGQLWLEDPGGCWRLMSFLPGRTFHRMDSAARAATSGALVGRFHAAVAGWDYHFEHRRSGAHDTPRHMDTLAALPLAVEMGDAWRSWCNPAGEDDPERVVFDMALFQASAAAWLSEVGPLSAEERGSLVPGIERICLELSARFCADAVRNTYFREDRERFPRAGEHNLWRARGQARLAWSAREQAMEAEELIQSASR